MAFDSKSPRALSTIGALLEASPALARHSGFIPPRQWTAAVGARLAEKAKPEELQGRVLVVRVPSSTWAQELSLLSSTIVSRLRERGHAVDRLRFRVAPAADARARKRPVRVQKATALPADLASKIGAVADEGLRSALLDAASYTLGRRR